MQCDCSCYDGVDATFSKTTWRKARKSHTCAECSAEIRPGERYEVTTGKWDGYMESHKTCKTCVAIRKNYCPGGWVYGELREHISYCLGFDYTKVPDDE
jgi:hypothetical protein